MQDTVFLLINEYAANDEPIETEVRTFGTKQAAIKAMNESIKNDKEDSWLSHIDQDDIEYAEDCCEDKSYAQYAIETSHDEDGDLIRWTAYEKGRYNTTHNEYRIVQQKIEN